MPHKLENLKITKVDFVEEGANPDADIGLTKSRSVQKGEGEAQTFDEALQERERRREMDRITDDMWSVCYALNDSLCSILFDEGMDAGQRQEAMLKSLDEFMATAKEAVTNWSGGQAVGYVVKSDSGAAEALADIVADTLAKSLARALGRMQKCMPEPSGEGPDVTVEPKGESDNMDIVRIDKSKLTPEELATLDAIEKKAGIPDEPPVSGEAAPSPATAQEPQPTAKSASAAPAAQPEPASPAPAAPGTEEDIYKGMSPAVRQEFEALRKFRQDTEDKELMEVAKGYGILGKNPIELFSVLKNLKTKDQSAYEQMISTLNDAKTAVEKSGAFGEIGKTGNGATGGGAVKETESKALELMKSRKDLTMAQAIDEVLQADPELAKRYETEDE